MWLALANGSPVIATRLLGGRWAWPLDGGRLAGDGRRLLGPSKTIRGLVLGVLSVALAAALVGRAWWLGALFGAAAMLGDAASSFVKRRMAIEPSDRAVGLDQIPEALLPLLVCYAPLNLNAASVALLVALFTLAQVLVSPIMYRLGVRRRPY
jgi:CDP-2,3-bis-(O-geranylgeranyl)-sn-glycerol synthase